MPLSSGFFSCCGEGPCFAFILSSIESRSLVCALEAWGTSPLPRCRSRKCPHEAARAPSFPPHWPVVLASRSKELGVRQQAQSELRATWVTRQAARTMACRAMSHLGASRHREDAPGGPAQPTAGARGSSFQLGGFPCHRPMLKEMLLRISPSNHPSLLYSLDFTALAYPIPLPYRLSRGPRRCQI